MILRLLLALALCLAATTVSADSIDIGFNDESFQLTYERPLTRDDYGTALANGRFLYNGDEKTTLGSIGADFVGEPGNVPGLGLGVGTKFYAGSTDRSTDFINLAIGLRGEYAPPQFWGLGVAGRLYYAPKVFSFRDSERLLESELRLTYAVLPKVKVYVGYQNIRLKEDRRNENWTIDDALRVGFVGYF
ncbi:YfaZ family protein [Geoalkalibacter halelectricus]|uniref:YfaZ family protein n=1 Tax=Geoalkalibacter halelectricus TaxID=2847045 RepID=A0ABY5ZNY2_9BACT|nr:YfaZ family protein [Geoalkalibacter halelectricus]MDO3378461.1 YfaZ family protein [Geoalkalibacter halelectricus]UWZ80219.1 YfaZ family protein [Geoalkalibacter halelectricus]